MLKYNTIYLSRIYFYSNRFKYIDDELTIKKPMVNKVCVLFVLRQIKFYTRIHISTHKQMYRLSQQVNVKAFININATELICFFLLRFALVCM